MPVTAQFDFGAARLLFNADNAIASHLRHAKPFGVVHLFQQNLGARLLLLEIFNGVPDTFLDDVVSEDHANLLPVGKVLGERQGIRDTACTFLVGVVQVFEANSFPLASNRRKSPELRPPVTRRMSLIPASTSV